MKDFLSSGLRLVALFGIGSGAASAGLAPTPALSGVITQIEGTVQVSGAGTQGLPLASPWQVIRNGITVRVPQGGQAGIVCSNRRFVRLSGPVSWSLSEEACAKGKELTPGEYALVAPRGGRLRVVEGIMVIEREIRTEDFNDPLAPIVLAPRTVLRSPRPTILWSRIPGATEYEIKWTGRGVDRPRVLQASEANCSDVEDDISVCSLPWPADRADLLPGETYFLRVSARSGLFEPWHSNDSVKVETQTLTAAEELERQLRDLERLGLPEATLKTAQAGLMAERGLLSEATERYGQALRLTQSQDLRVTLADTQFTAGLHFLAERNYREALADAEPAIEAAATFGLGRIAYARGDFREAEKYFHTARERYGALRLEEEREAAVQAEKRAGAKARQQPPKAP